MTPRSRGCVTRRTALAGLCATVIPLGRPRAQSPPAPAQAARILRATSSRRRLADDQPGPADLWSFEDARAPLVRVKLGEEVFVRLVNETTAPLSIHWQGIRGANAMDGVGGLTQEPVAPGASFEYRFTPPDAGTILMRPMVLGGSAEPAGRGLGGLLVVDEREPPEVAADVALLIRDWRFDPSGGLAPFGTPMEAALGGRLGNRLTIGEDAAPKRIEATAGSRIRLRLANASNARILRLRFDNLKVVVAAVDSQPAETFEPLRSSLPFPPGTRYDLLADLPAEPGAKGAIVAMLGDGLPLVEIVATAPAKAPGGSAAVGLARNPRLPQEIRLQGAVRRELTITGGATRGPDGQPVFSGDPRSIWAMAGAAGAAAPLFTAKRGQPVVLGLHNQTAFPQPMHLHGHVFRLLHNLDDGWEPYWLDTVQIAEGKTARIAFVADNPGKWLLGSSVLERLDTGLWTWFEVT